MLTSNERRTLLEFSRQEGYIILTSGNDLPRRSFVDVGTSYIIHVNKALTKTGVNVLLNTLDRSYKGIIGDLEIYLIRHRSLSFFLRLLVRMCRGFLSCNV